MNIRYARNAQKFIYKPIPLLYNAYKTKQKGEIMVEISKEILEKYGIYKTRKLEPKEKDKLLRMKKEIEKLINIPIEKFYLVDDCAWGKEAEKEKYTICILVDRRFKDLDESRKLLEEYCDKKDIEIIYWTLCQFEKRKNAPTEKDYYIYRYGIKVYDSEKNPEINENIKETEYAAQNMIYKSVGRYINSNPDFAMINLSRIYTLKIGYAAIGRNGDLVRDCEFAKLVSDDKRAINLIDDYLSQTDEKEKVRIKNEFAKYLNSIEQVKFPMNLDEKPTMNIYEKLLKKKEKEGSLDIKTLSKDELYIMYIIQNIYTHQIAELYGVENQKINAKRDNWHIKLREKGLADDEKAVVRKSIESAVKDNGIYAYSLLKKVGMMDFEECIFPILEYMMDDNTYLLKEFWQFTINSSLGFLIHSHNKDNYYQISICVELLMQNDLIKEVDFKQYRITKKGKELVNYCYRNDINKITISVIYDCFEEVYFYDLDYEDGYPTEFEELITDTITSQIENINENKEKIEIVEKTSSLKQVNFKGIKPHTKSNNQKRKGVKIDYIKTNEIKMEFGRKCEEIIYNYEIERLKKEGSKEADNVKWISRDEGDGLGYDIESFENRNGIYEKIYIEVKGTDKDITEPFEITWNEVEASNKYKDNYYLYRIAKVNTKNPEFYIVKGSIEDNFKLRATKYEVT